MVQYWWVNQTRSHQIERSKELVAGEKNVENNAKTHWGRKNVEYMRKGDFIVCYRSGIGIDRFAYVTKDGECGRIPWDVFCWDEIPGKDNERLKKYLKEGVDIDWGKNATIEKIDDKTIKVFTQIKSLLLKLDDAKGKVVLEINGDKIELILREENKKQNIYQENWGYRRAYRAEVKYISGINGNKKIIPIKKEAFWEDLKNIASGKKEPIDLVRNQVRYAYAMKLKNGKNAFNKIIKLVETENSGITNELSKRFNYNYE
jgi:hypothetical protein